MGKSRLDVWSPTISPVNSSGVFQATSLVPEKWITCETLGGTRRAGNALTSVEITDELYMPRTAKLILSNACPDFRAADNEVYAHIYKDSDGSNAFSSAVYLRKKWGPFSYFFEGREFIRVVDEDTGYVHFAGQITKIHKEYAQGRGLIITLDAVDALGLLNMIEMKGIGTDYRFAINKRRSQLIHFIVRMAQTGYLMNPELWFDEIGGGEDEEMQLLLPVYYSPYSSLLSSSLVTYDANPLTTGIALNHVKRFENSAWYYKSPLFFSPNNSASVTLLEELQRIAINEPHENESGTDHFGFTFYADPNISSQINALYRAKNLDATAPPPPQQLNYFLRGHRLAVSSAASGEPETYGLRVEMPVNNRIESGRTYTRSASRRIAGNFEVDNPSDEIFTTAIVEMPRIEDNLSSTTLVANEDRRHSNSKRTLKVEIFYVNQFSKGGVGEDQSFKWDDLPMTDEYGVDMLLLHNETPKAAEYVNVLDAEGTAILNHAGRIQYMADETEDSNDYTHILLSDLNRKAWVDPGTGVYISSGGNFPLANASGDDYVILKGSISGATCRLDLDSTNPAKGRPSSVLGAERTISMTLGVDNSITRLRQDIASKLSAGVFPIARTKFSLSKTPNYWVDLEILVIANVSTGGQSIQCKLQGDSGTTALSLPPYGIREGMLVTKMDSTYPNRVIKVNNKPVFGYIYNMGVNATDIDLDLTESQSFSVGDKLRIHVPIRAGDSILVDNPLIQMYGNHAVGKTVYRESSEGPATEFHTYGLNQRKTSGGGMPHSSTGTPVPQPEQLVTGGNTKAKGTFNSIIQNNKAVATQVAHKVFSEKSHFGGPLPVTSKDIAFTYPQSNRIEWTAGRLVLGDGSAIRIKASGSGSTSGTSNATYGLGSNGMTGTNEYMLYVDLRDSTSVNAEYNIRTILYATFRDSITVDRVAPLFKVRAGTNIPYVENHVNFIPETGSTPIKWEAYQFVQPASITGSLIAATTLTGANLVDNTITETQIGDNEISVGKLKANSVDTNQLVANAITTNKILAGAIVTDSLDANAVTAAKIDAGAIEAEAMSANALNAYIITLTGAGMLRTGTITLSGTGAASWALSGAGIAINTNGIFGASGSGASNMEFFIQASDGKAMFGGGVCTIGRTGIYIPNNTVATLGSIQFQHHTGGGSTFIYKRGSANNLMLQATGSTDRSANALLLLDMWLGNNDFRLDRVVTDYVRIHAASSSGPSSPGTDKGELFVLDGDDGLWWKFEGNTPVDLTGGGGGTSGGQIRFTNKGNAGSPALSWADDTNSGLWFYQPSGTFSGGNPPWSNPQVTRVNMAINGSTQMYWHTLDYHANAVFTGENRLVQVVPPLNVHRGIIFNKFTAPDCGGDAFLGGTVSGGSGVTYSAYDKGYLYCRVHNAGPFSGDEHLFWQGHDSHHSNTEFERRVAFYDEIQTSGNLEMYKYIAVAGQANVPAQNDYDTLTLIASTGVTITTNSSARSVTFAMSAGGFSDPLRLNNGAAGAPSFSFTGDTDTGMYLDTSSVSLAFSYGGSQVLRIGSSAAWIATHIAPTTYNSFDLGYSGSRWRYIFLLNNPNVSSDEASKENISPISNGLDFISRLNPVVYNRIGETQVDFGFTAQAVKQAALDSGYTEDIGIYTEDTDIDTGKTNWGVAYEELIAPLVASIKELKARIEILEGD